MKNLTLSLSDTGFFRPAFRAPLGKWLATQRQRARLASLSDQALEDLGLTREDAYREAARPFWDLPSNQR